MPREPESTASQTDLDCRHLDYHHVSNNRRKKHTNFARIKLREYPIISAKRNSIQFFLPQKVLKGASLKWLLGLRIVAFEYDIAMDTCVQSEMQLSPCACIRDLGKEIVSEELQMNTRKRARSKPFGTLKKRLERSLAVNSKTTTAAIRNSRCSEVVQDNCFPRCKTEKTEFSGFLKGH